MAKKLKTMEDVAVENSLNAVKVFIEQKLDESYNGRCISNKEMTLACLDACCPANYRTEQYNQAIELIGSI